MLRLIKFLLVALVALVVAAIVAVLVIPKSVILNQVLAQVERQTGRSISVGEDVSLSLFPQIKLSANDLRVANADWAQGGDMITAREVRFGVETMPLLRGDVIADTIELIAPNVQLETAADGTGNWVLGTPSEGVSAQSQSAGAATALPHFKSIVIKEGALSYRSDGTATKIDDLKLILNWPEYNGDVDVDLDVRVNGMAAQLRGLVSTLPQLINDGQASVQISAASYDAYSANGAVSVDVTGAVPMLRGQLVLGPINIASSTGGNGGAATASQGWSTAAIDASGLGAVNADLRVSGPSIKAAGLSIGRYSAHVVLDAARAVVTLDELAAYEGQTTGQIVVNARKGLSASAKLNVANVAAQPLLRDVAGIEAFSAPLSAQADVLVVGSSLDAMMRSLQGAISFSSAGGHIEGVDLDKVLRSGDVSGGTTVFDDLSASFVAQNGVLTGDDLALILPNFRTDGAGAIDVGGQRIDYLITPKATAARDGKGLAIPVRVKGPWSKPQILPDLEALAQENLAEEIEKARAAAEEKAKALIKEKTGLEIKDGQSVEDAAQEKVQSEVKKTEEAAKKKVEDEVKKLENDVKKKLEDELKKNLGGLGGIFGN